MAGKPFTAIDVIDLSSVWGGIAVDAPDKQTRAMQLAIGQATSDLASLAASVAPKQNNPIEMLLSMLSMMSGRGSGSGPTPAPALPPTSTLTR